MKEDMKTVSIEEVENGYVVYSNSGTFVFTSGNSAMKAVRELMGLAKTKADDGAAE